MDKKSDPELPANPKIHAIDSKQKFLGLGCCALVIFLIIIAFMLLMKTEPAQQLISIVLPEGSEVYVGDKKISPGEEVQRDGSRERYDFHVPEGRRNISVRDKEGKTVNLDLNVSKGQKPTTYKVDKGSVTKEVEQTEPEETSTQP